MAICPNCGNNISENDKFCMRCGCNVQETSAPQQNYEQTQNTNPQGYDQQQVYNQQAYANQGYNQAPNPQGYAQPQGYNNQQAYTNQGYNQAPNPQGYAQPQDYNQQAYNQPQYNAEQNYYQPQPQYQQPKKKKKWLIPTIIAGAAVVVGLVIAIVLFMIPDSPEKATENAFNDRKEKIVDMFEENADDIIDSLPSQYSALISPYKKEALSLIETLADSVELRVTNVQENGNTATVTAQVYVPDFDKIEDELDEAALMSAFMSGGLSSIIDSFEDALTGEKVPVRSKPFTIKLNKVNGKWEPDLSELFDGMDLDDIEKNIKALPGMFN